MGPGATSGVLDSEVVVAESAGAASPVGVVAVGSVASGPVVVAGGVVEVVVVCPDVSVVEDEDEDEEADGDEDEVVDDWSEADVDVPPLPCPEASTVVSVWDCVRPGATALVWSTLVDLAALAVRSPVVLGVVAGSLAAFLSDAGLARWGAAGWAVACLTALL
jgi:hypothetical protein